MPPPRDSSLKRRLSLKAEGLSNPSVGAGMYARRNDAKQAGVGAVNHSASEPSFFADPFSNGVVNHLADASANGDPQATSGLHGTDSVGHPLQAGAPPDASGPFGLHPNEISRQIHSSASYSEASGYEHHPLPGSAHSYVGSPPTSNGHHMASFSGPSGGYAPPQYGAPHMPAHILHRASISGPIMQHGSYGGPTAAAVTTAGLASGAHAGGSITAPPMAGDTAAWAHAHGAPRPHTADGMFGSFGFGANGYAPASTEGSAAAESEVSYARGDHSQHLLFNYPSQAGARPHDGLANGSAEESFTSSVDGGGDDGSYDGGSNGGSVGASASGTPGHKKRPRRRYDEIERMYACSWPGCSKSYGTLNHLNAHVAMQKHGSKRLPAEFKDMRKAWRKAKREEEQRRMAQAQQTVNAHAAAAVVQGRHDQDELFAAHHRVHTHPAFFGNGSGSMGPPTWVPPAHGAYSMGPPQQPYHAQPQHLGSSLSRPGAMQPPLNTTSAVVNGGSGSAGGVGEYAPPSGLGGPPPGQYYASSAPQPAAEIDHRPYVPPSAGGLGAYLMAHRGSI